MGVGWGGPRINVDNVVYMRKHWLDAAAFRFFIYSSTYYHRPPVDTDGCILGRAKKKTALMKVLYAYYVVERVSDVRDFALSTYKQRLM